MLAYVQARREPPGDHGGDGNSPGGDATHPIAIVLGVWLWAILAVIVLGVFVSWL